MGSGAVRFSLVETGTRSAGSILANVRPVTGQGALCLATGDSVTPGVVKSADKAADRPSRNEEVR
jgi:hypothetical protein